MITPNTTQSTASVATHYDQLDKVYRQIWGEHVHHGYWQTGNESSDEAVKKLVALVGHEANLKQSSRICDVGSGYGATSRMLAETFSADVTAFTVSPAQFAFANAVRHAGKKPHYLLQDWNENTLPKQSFDAVIAIESSEHIDDKPRFFAEAHRVLDVDGRLVVCAWIAKENPKPFEIRFLLEPICREGRLPGMGTVTEYCDMMYTAGFKSVSHQNISQQVKKTWPICIGRFLKACCSDSEIRGMLFDRNKVDREFAKTVFRIWLAYEMGSMQYHVFTAS